MTTHHNHNHNRGRDHARAGGLSARTDRVASWIGWHLGELVGVGLPLVLAATVSGWFGLVSVVVLAGWVAHEVRTSRRHPVRPVATRAALPAADHTECGEVPGESA